jgi:hypothetical protein
MRWISLTTLTAFDRAESRAWRDQDASWNDRGPGTVDDADRHTARHLVSRVTSGRLSWAGPPRKEPS